MSGWHHRGMCCFDLETTGIDVEQDRIVTAAIAVIPDASHGTPRIPQLHSWLVNPGIDIPAPATAVHGVTTEHAQARGVDPVKVVPAIVGLLGTMLGQAVPVVGMNLQYDLTLLDRECERYGLDALDPGNLRPVVDVFVIDKEVDRYRKGSRKLTALCDHYGCKIEGAHDSAADALAAARVAWRIAEQYPDIGAMKLEDLHDAQVRWRAGQQSSFADHLRSKGDHAGADSLSPHWPMIPRRAAA